MSSPLTDGQIQAHLDELVKSKPLESYCNNCGDCCSPSVMVKSSSSSPFKILVKDLSCKFSKSVNGESTCTVYSERFKKASWCLDLRGMIKGGVAPHHCPYVETLAGYQPTLDLQPPQYGSVLPLLKKAVSQGDTTPFEDADIKKFLGE